MARNSRTGSRKSKPSQPRVDDYRHDEAKRKNNPPAKIAAEGVVPIIPKVQYSYSPRRPPVLRFDPDGSPDKLPELLEAARQRPLTDDELKLLAEALRNHEPWLEWAEKREQHQRGFFEVDPVALHIHERISTQAILKVAARQDVQRSLFADPEQEYHQAVQFYQHDIDWTNRLILGDSLQVMSSLARREDLAGKVQMIYIDPPYGIKFASNFQPEIRRKTVEDREQDLTREPEVVKAYRDTWHLGVHSYLSYLRDRLILARELLADAGSIFVQISDENVHLVRQVLDEVFGCQNFCSVVPFTKTSGQTRTLLPVVTDYLLWYARDISQVRYCQLYQLKTLGGEGSSEYFNVELPTGEVRRLLPDEIEHPQTIPPNARVFATDSIVSEGGTEQGSVDIPLGGGAFVLRCGPKRHWKVSPEGVLRVWRAGLLVPREGLRIYKRYFENFPCVPINSVWTDTRGETDMAYVVQTSRAVTERCMLMTTHPGDLVLDPTCGSGTTAYVAEQWGRRWITIDTSRVAIAIARQRLLTAKFDYYELKHEAKGVAGGFVCKTVPHITLKSIAQNTNLDPIFAKHEPVVDEKLAACNKALGQVTDALRQQLELKLLTKQKQEGKQAITDADRRRWMLPGARPASGQAQGPAPTEGFQHWTVPFDTDPDWPKALQDAVTEYRKAWRAKMDEVNACIAANVESEELVDQPQVVKGVVRVSGPFTVEAVQPPEMTLGKATVHPPEGKFDGEPEEVGPTFVARDVETRLEQEAKNLDAYLDQMLRLLKVDGVRFPNNKQMMFSRLEPLQAAEPGLHAEGRWVLTGQKDDDPDGKATVCVAFGPQYGPVTAMMVEDVIRSANRMGYDDLVIAGFSFDGPSQAVIQETQHMRLHTHAAHIRPDVNPGMNGLLKEQPGSQLFTVFGLPRTRVDGPDKDGLCTVVMEGVDIYNPVDNSIVSTGADKVAAWFIDGDYDGWTFCITQAFFPDRSAWDKLSRALKGVIDEEAFEAFSGTVSLPFPLGKHKCIAVKVIDPRGNEVMRVHKLGGGHA